MPTWVIRKTLPTHDHSPYAPHRTPHTPGYLYWAGPDPLLPHATSWAWLTDLCPLVASFPTQAHAEAAAHSFAGAHGDTAGVHAALIQAADPLQRWHTAWAEKAPKQR